jgi:hypothetical protein
MDQVSTTRSRSVCKKSASRTSTRSGPNWSRKSMQVLVPRYGCTHAHTYTYTHTHTHTHAHTHICTHTHTHTHTNMVGPNLTKENAALSESKFKASLGALGFRMGTIKPKMREISRIGLYRIGCLFCALALFRSRSLARSLSRSLARSLSRSLALSLSRLLSPFLSISLSLSLSRARAHYHWLILYSVHMFAHERAN